MRVLKVAKDLDNKVELLWNEMESNLKNNKPNYQIHL